LFTPTSSCVKLNATGDNEDVMQLPMHWVYIRKATTSPTVGQQGLYTEAKEPKLAKRCLMCHHDGVYDDLQPHLYYFVPPTSFLGSCAELSQR
jgi:hypothetical protein